MPLTYVLHATNRYHPDYDFDISRLRTQSENLRASSLTSRPTDTTAMIRMILYTLLPFKIPPCIMDSALENHVALRGLEDGGGISATVGRGQWSRCKLGESPRRRIRAYTRGSADDRRKSSRRVACHTRAHTKRGTIYARALRARARGKIRETRLVGKLCNPPERRISTVFITRVEFYGRQRNFRLQVDREIINSRAFVFSFSFSFVARK